MRAVVAVKNARGYRLTVSQDQPDVMMYGMSYAPMMTSKPVYILDGLRVTQAQAEAILFPDRIYRGSPTISVPDGRYAYARPHDPVLLEITDLQITEAEARAIAVDGRDPVLVLSGSENGIALVFNIDSGARL